MAAKKEVAPTEETPMEQPADYEDKVRVIATKMFPHEGKQIFPGDPLEVTKGQAGHLGTLVTPYSEIGGVYAPEDHNRDQLAEDEDPDLEE